MTVGAIALIASGAFSIGELTGAHRTAKTNAISSAPAPAPTGSSGLSGLPGLSGLSLSGLENLANQVSQAAAIAQSTGSVGSSAEQLQAELNAINACLGGSSSAC